MFGYKLPHRRSWHIVLNLPLSYNFLTERKMRWRLHLWLEPLERVMTQATTKWILLSESAIVYTHRSRSVRTFLRRPIAYVIRALSTSTTFPKKKLPQSFLPNTSTMILVNAGKLERVSSAPHSSCLTRPIPLNCVRRLVHPAHDHTFQIHSLIISLRHSAFWLIASLPGSSINKEYGRERGDWAWCSKSATISFIEYKSYQDSLCVLTYIVLFEWCGHLRRQHNIQSNDTHRSLVRLGQAAKRVAHSLLPMRSSLAVIGVAYRWSHQPYS